MARGSLPGEHRGGRKKGTPNKKKRRLPVTIEAAEAEVRRIMAAPVDVLGKDRLTQIDNWAFNLATAFAPTVDDKGVVGWATPGDEARFERYIKLSVECAARRAPYESPKLRALAVAAPSELPGGVPLLDYDPKERLKQIVTNIIQAKEAARAEAGLPADPMEALKLENEQLRAEIARLRGEPPRVITPGESDITPPAEVGEFFVGGPRPAPDDPKPPQTIDGEVLSPEPKPQPPRPLSAAERQANVDRVNSDYSAYEKQGLRRQTYSEPWRRFVGREW